MFKKLILLIIIGLSLIGTKFPEITEKNAKQKIEEILQAHASYKKITPQIAERVLKNYLEQLDPTKTYFIESDIQKWLYPNDEITNNTIEALKNGNFQLFEEIHEIMLKAIQRRNNLEIQANNKSHPQNVDAEEFKEMDWTFSKNELIDRLLKIKSLQLETAAKFNDESQENFMARLTKRRLRKESDLNINNIKDKKALIISNIMKAFCHSLDSHTEYLTPNEANQFMIQMQQRLFGIGALLKDNLNGFSIMRIIEGGPAEKQNLKIGDRIIAVNKDPVVGMDIQEAVDLIRGEKGTKVELTIIRESKENEKTEKFDINITRGEVILEESRLETTYEPYGDGVIAYLRLFSFYQDPKYSSANDLKKALDSLKKKHKIKGVVLDLRSNSGGVLNQAVEVTGLFITKGVVVSIKDSLGNVQHLRDTDGKMEWDGPLTVLINKASASASEIVAQTLQDYGRAIVIGDEHSFGKGSYQTMTIDGDKSKINPQGEFKVTRGRYYTVSGKSPQLVGVKSDIITPGLLSEMEFGEKHSKFPLENDEIPSNFDDDLSDILPIHRKRIALLYKHNIQQKTKAFTQYLDILKSNSEKRIKDNKNYQSFLKEIKNKNFEAESIEIFGQTDLQLQEAYNITKDLVFLTEINDKQFE